MVHNWLNLGSQSAQIGRCVDAALERRCPYCEEEETFVHLLSCTAPRAQRPRYDALGELHKGRGSSQSGVAIYQAVVNAWILAPTAVVHVTLRTRAYVSIIESALASQTKIGWEHLLRGFVSEEWGTFYHPTDATPLEIRQSRAATALPPPGYFGTSRYHSGHLEGPQHGSP
jgi:hypothetical protein